MYVSMHVLCACMHVYARSNVPPPACSAGLRTSIVLIDAGSTPASSRKLLNAGTSSAAALKRRSTCCCAPPGSGSPSAACPRCVPLCKMSAHACTRVTRVHACTRELARTLVTRMRRLSAREPERREPRPRSTGRARRRGSDTRQGCSAEALQRLEHLLPCCVLRRHHCRPRMVSRRRNSCPAGGRFQPLDWPKAHGGSRHLGHSIIRVGRGGWPGQP